MKALATALVLLAAAAPACAQSLLGENGGSPYDPPKAPVYKKHDRFLVRFPAASATEAPVEGRAERTSPGQLGLDRTARPAARPAPGVEVSTALPVEVVDIRPNGVLVVQAIRRRRVNGVEETLRVTGEVSPKDVSGGEVPLDHVANLSVAYDGGPVRLPGWLMGVFGRIWTF